MKLAILIVVPMLFAMASNGDSFGQSLRIATYNVNWENTAPDQMLDAIRESNADVACIQETTTDWFRLFKIRLNELYPCCYKANQFTFLSKRSLHGIEANDHSEYAIATLAVEGHRLQIVNVHLSPLNLPGNANILALMKELTARDEKHVNELRGMLRTLDLTIPTTIVGDFNGISESKASLVLQQAGFRDSFASVNHTPDQFPTWDLNRMLAIEAGQHPKRLTDAANYIPVGLRLDYIYHCDKFETTASHVIRREGSDHYLTVSELRILGGRSVNALPSECAEHQDIADERKP